MRNHFFFNPRVLGADFWGERALAAKKPIDVGSCRVTINRKLG